MTSGLPCIEITQVETTIALSQQIKTVHQIICNVLQLYTMQKASFLHMSPDLVV